MYSKYPGLKTSPVPPDAEDSPVRETLTGKERNRLRMEAREEPPDSTMAAFKNVFCKRQPE